MDLFGRLTVAASLVVLFALPETGTGSDLPEIACDNRSCREVPPDPSARPRAASPLPFEAAPPAGQRLLFKGAGNPLCQSIVGVTSASLYEYIAATNIDVPLGTSHISLDASVGTQQTVTSGTIGAFGKLQVRRTGAATWTYNANAGSAGTTSGSTGGAQYALANYIALVDLADLPDGTGIPAQIDVRLAFFESKTPGATSTLNSLCNGQLRLAF